MLPVGVGDDPVQVCDGEIGRDGLGDDGCLREGLADLVERAEVARDPEGKLVSGDVDGIGVRRGLGRIAGALREIETRDREAGVVAAIKVERRLVEHNGHTDDGMGATCVHIAGAIEGGGHLRRRRRHHHALTIALSPIEIATEVHRSGRAGKADARAHGPAPFPYRAAKPAEQLV